MANFQLFKCVKLGVYVSAYSTSAEETLIPVKVNIGINNGDNITLSLNQAKMLHIMLKDLFDYTDLIK